jgi:hypothetical protein
MIPKDPKDIKEMEDVLEEDVVNIIMSTMKGYFKGMHMIGKRILKELMAVMFGSLKSDKPFVRILMDLDYKYIEQLQKVIEQLKEARKLPADFDSKEASMAIYSIFLIQLMLYVYEEDITNKELKSNVERQVRFLFDGKCIV